MCVQSFGTQREKRRGEIKKREAWCEERLLAPSFSPIFSCAIFRAAPELTKHLEKLTQITLGVLFQH